jgi:hypothetical protein
MPSTSCNRGGRICATDDSVETMDRGTFWSLACAAQFFRQPKKCAVSSERVSLFRFGLGMSLYISEVNSLDNPDLLL